MTYYVELAPMSTNGSSDYRLRLDAANSVGHVVGVSPASMQGAMDLPIQWTTSAGAQSFADNLLSS